MGRASRRSQALPGLSPAQREIMEIVWARGEVSASEVRTLLSRKRDVARNTARTLLERMEKKGWLKHREEDRTYLYSAAQPRPVAIGQAVLKVVDHVCGGSPEVLLTALLDHRGLSADELARIRSMLEKAKANEPPKGGELSDVHA
jgi:BlaI family transcriptional regulator, penicillinase repressor